MKHLHHVFVGYKEKDGDRFLETTTVEVVDCQTEDEALKKAKEILVRPGYYLQKVWECSACAHNAEALATQRYMAALIGKHLKGDES